VYYPVFLDLRGRAALVVGGGPVAARKAAALAEAGARVTAVSPRFGPGRWAGVRRRRRPFRASDLAGARIVVCATDDAALQTRVALLCEARGIFVNVVDVPERCSFIVPARLRRGPLTLCVATDGASPALAGSVRRELQQLYPPAWASLVRSVARRRRAARATAAGPKARRAAARRAGSMRVVRAMRRGGLPAALRELQRC
jgi:siroheme synthase-like protein